MEGGTDIDCIICLGNVMNRSNIDSCDHVFCFNCITEWSKITNSCPVCKINFKKIIASKTPIGKKKSGKVVKVLDREQKVAYEDTGLYLANAVDDMDGMGAELVEWELGYLNDEEFDIEERFQSRQDAYRRQSLHQRLLDSVIGSMNSRARRSVEERTQRGAAGRANHPRERRDNDSFIASDDDFPEMITAHAYADSSHSNNRRRGHSGDPDSHSLRGRTTVLASTLRARGDAGGSVSSRTGGDNGANNCNRLQSTIIRSDQPSSSHSTGRRVRGGAVRRGLDRVVGGVSVAASSVAVLADRNRIRNTMQTIGAIGHLVQPTRNLSSSTSSSSSSSSSTNNITRASTSTAIRFATAPDSYPPSSYSTTHQNPIALRETSSPAPESSQNRARRRRAPSSIILSSPDSENGEDFFSVTCPGQLQQYQFSRKRLRRGNGSEIKNQPDSSMTSTRGSNRVQRQQQRIEIVLLSSDEDENSKGQEERRASGLWHSEATMTTMRPQSAATAQRSPIVLKFDHLLPPDSPSPVSSCLPPAARQRSSGDVNTSATEETSTGNHDSSIGTTTLRKSAEQLDLLAACSIQAVVETSGESTSPETIPLRERIRRHMT